VRFLLCIAGLPQEAVDRVKALSPALFTEAKTNLPIIRVLRGEFAYRDGMSDYFLGQLAERLEHIPPEEEVSIGLIYANHAGAARFLEAFFPFAVAVPVDPFYPSTWLKHERQARLAEVEALLVASAEQVRERILLMRDTLSGQKFSPLLLPLRNFRSDILEPAVREIFEQIGSGGADRAMVQGWSNAISESHPLTRVAIEKLPPRPYFEDASRLRFMSPGTANHGVVRTIGEGHVPACLINGRVRLGAPIRSGFHYDCSYEKGGLDPHYPNCHAVDQAPASVTHVNISPNDAIR
jgi:hypothetical protein